MFFISAAGINSTSVILTNENCATQMPYMCFMTDSNTFLAHANFSH